MQRYSRAQAQALVEFALSATLIFFLLAAAVDLGLLFFTQQAITNAAQEGASYGSRWLIDATDPTDATKKVRVLNVAEIQRRVRFESGTNGGNGIQRLTDLNADGVDDGTQSTIVDPTGKTGYIQVKAVQDTNTDGDPTNDNGTLCANPASSTYSCYAVVTVKKVYKMFFPLSPAFGKQFQLTSTYYLLIRDSYQVSSSVNQPIIVAPTPTPSADQIKIKFIIPNASDGATVSATNNMKIEVQAYDESKTSNGTNGVGITQVLIQLVKPDNTLAAVTTDASPQYCLFGGGCNAMTPSSIWTSWPTGTTYRLMVTATATDGRTNSAMVNLKK